MLTRADKDAARLDGLGDRAFLVALALKLGTKVEELIANEPACDDNDDSPGSIMSLGLLESLR